ncbi:MAG: hypothetical protein KC457_07270 [Myxococcales bacterium]|nr:hypothetical protein [Myxococcales bacterium]
MSTHKKTPDELVTADGILYASISSPSSHETVGTAGAGEHAEICAAACDMLRRHVKPAAPGGLVELRVMLDETCIAVLGKGSNVVALVMTKGHPVIKSAKRVMRKALARLPETTTKLAAAALPEEDVVVHAGNADQER